MLATEKKSHFASFLQQWQMTDGHMPRTCESYSYSDILELPFFKEERYAAYAKNAAQNRDAASSER